MFYKIIDDSGIPYGFINTKEGSWLNEIVYGNTSEDKKEVVFFQPNSTTSLCSAPASCLEPIETLPEEWSNTKIKEILALAQTRSFCPKGWIPLVIEGYYKLLEITPDFVLLQIKQKWGRLEIYVAPPDHLELTEFSRQLSCYSDTLRSIKNKALNVCEKCGASPASNSKIGYWWSVLCPNCEKEYDSKPS